MTLKELAARKYAERALNAPESVCDAKHINTAPRRENAAQGILGESRKVCKAIFRDVYNFYEKYVSLIDSPDYWETVMEEAEAIAARYGNHGLAVDLLLGVHSELERIYKEVHC